MLVLLCTVFSAFVFVFLHLFPYKFSFQASQVSESETPSTGDWGRLEAQASSFSRLSFQDIPSLGLHKIRLEQIVSSKGQNPNKCLLLQLCVPQPFECFWIKMNKAKSCQAWFWVAGLVGLELLELAGLPGWWVRSHYCCPNILVLAMNSE